ncbi:MAG: response regulator transcription factor [Alphaproteobacteria bacterium]|nr:response regulator transcription factor [Alphaproteobacteria bacterium]
MRLLLIEDNERLSSLLEKGLGFAGFDVDIVTTATDAEEALRAAGYAAVVLDLGLPDGDGFNLLREARRRGSATPILILTARGGVKDRVKGLQNGADDYMAKPFALEELIARLQALLRRPGNLLGLALTVGNVTLDTEARQVDIDKKTQFFSAREIAVLEILMRRSGRVVSKKLVEDQLFGLSGEVGSNAIEVYVYRIRKQLAEAGATAQIQTIRGVGYMIAEGK